jgi:hypothetical protein
MDLIICSNGSSIQSCVTLAWFLVTFTPTNASKAQSLSVSSALIITINVPLRSGQFKGSKKSWPPQNVPRNGS